MFIFPAFLHIFQPKKDFKPLINVHYHVMLTPTRCILNWNSTDHLQPTISGAILVALQPCLQIWNHELSSITLQPLRSIEWYIPPGKIVSNHGATTEHWQALNIAHIQYFVTCNTSPMPVLVRNFAEEIHGSRLKESWTVRFIQCHSIHLKTLYLCDIVNLRKKTQYASYFILFYDLVYT